MWKEVDGCRDLEQRPTAPEGKMHMRVHEVWNAGDDRVSLGEAGSSDAAVGWRASTRAVSWETWLAADEHPKRPKSVTRAAIDAKGFFFLYTTREGPSRLVGLDTKTGDRRFDIELEGSAIGTRLHDVVAGGEDVLVSMNEELVVVDARSGRIRGRLGSF
jgi:hypothetical protein